MNWKTMNIDREDVERWLWGVAIVTLLAFAIYRFTEPKECLSKHCSEAK